MNSFLRSRPWMIGRSATGVSCAVREISSMARLWNEAGRLCPPTGPGRSTLVVCPGRPHPDVAELHRVAVLLEQDGSLRTVGLVGRACPVGHRAEQGGVVVDDDTVVEHGRIRGRLERAVVIE